MQKSLSQVSRELNQPISRIVSACNRLQVFTERLGDHRNATRLVTPEQEKQLTDYFAPPAPTGKQGVTLSFHRPAVTKLGDPRANFVDGLHINRAVIFRAGDKGASGSEITREAINRIQHKFSEAGTVKIYSSPEAETVAQILGVASSFRVADSQLVANLDLLESNPAATKIADAIKRNPASVSFMLTDDLDGLVATLDQSGTALTARGMDILKFARLSPADYSSARKAGRI